MKTKPENLSAFPHDDIWNAGVITPPSSGMTLRDYFAGQALMSMLSPVQDISESTPPIAARLAYSFADAMLEARVA